MEYLLHWRHRLVDRNHAFNNNQENTHRQSILLASQIDRVHSNYAAALCMILIHDSEAFQMKMMVR